MSLAPKTVLITGGTRGLGLAIGQAFARKGMRLILTYRGDHENAESTRRRFADQGVECHCLAIDLSEEEASPRLAEAVEKVTKELSVYVHNAAATAFKPLMEIKPHHIQKTYQVTVGSFIQNVQWVADKMPQGGAILTVSGIDTKEAVPNHGLLASAKASLEMLTAYFAHELAPRKIRVNGVNPGYLETDSMRRYLGPLYEQATQFVAACSPMRQTARLEDVASVVVFLASEEARWILGQTLTLDGGQSFSSPVSLFMQRAKP